MENKQDVDVTSFNQLVDEKSEQPTTSLSSRKWYHSLVEVVKDMWKLCVMASPLLIANLLNYGRPAITALFLGGLGEESLAGGSMAMGFANITGYSVLSSLPSALDTISSQAMGANQWHSVGDALRRTILILWLACLPISLSWVFSHSILSLLRQDPSIVPVAATYLLYLLPDLLLVALLHCLRTYLRTQKITRPLVISATVSLALHIPLNFLLVHKLEAGIKGVAICVSLTDLNNILLLVCYLYVTAAHKRTWGSGWSRECLRGWPSILALAIPSCISGCLEWWWYEIMILSSGRLPNPKEVLSTMGIMIQATSLVYNFPYSLSNALSTCIGSRLGAGEPALARRASVSGLCCAVLSSVAAVAFAMTTSRLWGSVFSNNGSVVALTAMVMPVMGLCEIGNCPQTAICGVLRGTARPLLGVGINLGAFYGIGLPVGFVLAFVCRKGLLGLWMGMAAAQATCATMMLVALFKIDWEKEATRAKDRFREKIESVGMLEA